MLFSDHSLFEFSVNLSLRTFDRKRVSVDIASFFNISRTQPESMVGSANLIAVVVDKDNVLGR